MDATATEGTTDGAQPPTVDTSLDTFSGAKDVTIRIENHTSSIHFSASSYTPSDASAAAFSPAELPPYSSDFFFGAAAGFAAAAASVT